METAKSIRWAVLITALIAAGCQPTPFVPSSASPTLFTPPTAAPTTPPPLSTLTATPYIPVPVTPAIQSTATASATPFIPPPVTPTLFIPSEVPPSPTLFVPPKVPPVPPPPPTLFIPSPPPVALQPGVFVTGIRLDPPHPLQKQDVTFYVTFLNTTGVEQKYRWFIFIYLEDQSTPFGQTSSDMAYIIPPGTSEQVSLNTWKMGPGQPCTNLTAEVHWIGPEDTRPAFAGPNGRDFVFPFTVCPPP